MRLGPVLRGRVSRNQETAPRSFASAAHVFRRRRRRPHRWRLLAGFAADLAPSLGADEIVIEPERLFLLREGELVADLSAQAFLWFHGRAFQVPFWTTVLAIRRAQLVHEEIREQRAVPKGSETTRRALEHALAEMTRTGGLPSGVTIDPLESFGNDQLLIRIRSGSEAVELIVSSARQGGPRLFQLGPFLFSYPSDSPIAGAASLSLVRQFVMSFKRALKDSAAS
jgi:hypothetical protein